MWYVFLGILFVNLLGAAGFVGWMYVDGRIDEDRLDSVVDTFRMTIQEEALQDADAQLAAEESQKILEQHARLESVGKGPTTLREQLDKAQQADETALEKIKFFNAQNKALREEMARFKADHSRRAAQLDEERKTFEQWIKDRADQTSDANFQQVIELYETQAPKQTKQAFQVLMAQGLTDQVVEYLAAMSSRKAGKVLAQFKSPQEVPQASDLLERLRNRGEYTPDQQTQQLGN